MVAHDDISIKFTNKHRRAVPTAATNLRVGVLKSAAVILNVTGSAIFFFNLSTARFIAQDLGKSTLGVNVQFLRVALASYTQQMKSASWTGGVVKAPLQTNLLSWRSTSELLQGEWLIFDFIHAEVICLHFLVALGYM